jgi:hypothetical protein
MAFLGDQINAAVDAAPDLLNSPELLLGAAQTSDPAGTAQTLAHTSNTVALTDAITQHSQTHGPSFIHQLFGGIGTAVKSVGHVAAEGLGQLARPLGDVQHDYRYLRDVYQHHGFFAGFAESLAVLGAGVGATVLSGGNVSAGIVAAGATASLEQRLFFHDSADRTRNAQAAGYQPGVSPGRDVAHLLGLHDTNSGLGKIISGATDLTLDFTADPLIGAGKLASLRKSTEGWTAVKGYRAAAQAQRTNALTSFVDRFAPGMGIRAGDDGLAKVDQARMAYGGYRNALTDIARLDAGGVVRKYGRDYDGIAADLGKATTPDQVHDVFRRAAADADFNGEVNRSMLPSRSLLRVPFSAAVEGLRNVAPEGVAAEQKGVVAAVGSSLLHPTEAGANLSGAVARKVRTFSGYMPFAIDKGTGALSGRTFNPEDGSGLVGMLHALSFSLGEKQARKVVSDFAYADTLAEKKEIYTAGVTKAFIAAGLPDDHQLVTTVHDLTSGNIHGLADRELMGRGLIRGEAVSAVRHAGGTDHLALQPTETGDWSFPDFWQLKNAVRDMHAYSRLYGRVDDGAAHYYTNGFFKPLALLSLGFGLRVAASEMIPATMRYGAAAMLSGAIAKSAAKQNYKLAAGEDGHVLAATSRMVGGLDKLVNSEADRNLANDIALWTGGHMTRGVAGTGMNPLLLDESGPERAAGAAWYMGQRVSRVASQADKNVWQSLTPGEKQFQDYWLTNLQKRTVVPSGRLIAKDLADADRQGLNAVQAHEYAAKRETERIRAAGVAGDPYAKERDALTRYQVQAPEDFAADRVDDVHNLLRGDDGTFHQSLARKVAAGQKPMGSDLDKIDVTAHPGAVVGHPQMTYLGNNQLQRFVNGGYKKLIDPAINHISREPIFFQAVKENRKLLQGFVDSGALTEQEALTRAMHRGVLDMLPQIHNTALRSQFSQLARNFLPFYFAQEQAMKRAGYLISKHPEALRQYQLVEHGLSDPGFVHTDDQGNRSLMIPLVGEMGKGVLAGAQAIGLPVMAGLPLAVSGDMTSLRTVLPEMQQPGVTPLGAIALNKIGQLFPEFSPEVKAVLGPRGYGRSVQDQLIPNSPLRAAVKGLQADEGDRSFSTAFASALASAAYHGQLPPPDASPAEKQAFIDRIKNNTRSMFFLKAILATVSPLSPTVKEEDAGLADEFRKLVKDKGGYAAAVQAFIAEHGDKAISYTVAKSESTNGAQIPYTQAAFEFLTANRDLITNGKTQLAAAYLVPQTEGPGDIQAIHEEMLRMHLRQTRTPEDFRDALYTAQGDRQYFASYAQHQAAVSQLAADPQALAAEQAQWSDYVDGMKIANPVWAADFFSPVKGQRALATADQLGTLLASGRAPAGAQTDLVRGLWEDFQTHQQALATLGTDRSTAHARQVERDNWSAFLDQRESEEPRLATVISSVFKPLTRTA